MPLLVSRNEAEKNIFQQENAPHTSAVAEKCIHDHNVRMLLPWTPNSPDLSPIKYVRSVLARKMNDRRFYDKKAPREAEKNMRVHTYTNYSITL